MTTDLILIRAIQCGLTVADFEELSIGMVLDLLIGVSEFSNSKVMDRKERYALQGDFDKF